MLRFVSPLIVVEEISRSRQFYEDCLGQKIRYDFGVDVEFEGCFSIHQKAHFQGLLGEARRFPIVQRSNSGELYFDTDEIEAVQTRLEQAGVEFIHKVEEMPWGQRAMRLYDPDGHIIEIGETMEGAVRRLHQQGLTIEAIHQRTGMPEEFVEKALQDPVEHTKIA
jgi:predicted enzyme related to lactoylglutathione lyase